VNIKKSILLRVRIAFLLVVLFAMAIVAQIVNLQFVQGGQWKKMAQEIGLQFRKVKATRGNIYSDNGSLLATSLPFYKVAFDPTIADEEVYKKGIDSLASLLSTHFKDQTPLDYKRKIHNARVKGKQYVVLNSKLINYQEKKKMLSWPIFRLGRHKGGIVFEKVDKRFRPFSNLGFRTIGFINENNHGAGLEYSFNRELGGKDGEALFQKMAGGNWKPIHDGSEVRPIEGLDIETTIDVNLQDVSESALLRALQEHRADYGCVVVMEVKTGEIKAISNLSKNSAGQYLERYNYAVASQGLTEPGSTFKLLSMIALFEDSNVQPEDSIETGKGEFLFYDKKMTDAKPGGYGKITVQQAFEKSSNIAMSKMINNQFGLKPQRFIDYINNIGLGQPLGFQMIGEGVPYIKSVKDPSWSGITLPWMSIGYELKLTPLQILTLYNAVANEGKMIQPIIVKRIKRADKTVDKFEARVINKRICSKETLKKVKRLLEGVVENGTASNIKDSYYSIAGKTGTSKKVKDGKYTNSYYTSFAGYFPADRPKYSCIVVIDNPQGFRQYGSDVAAPVFKEIADKIYARDIEMHGAYPGEYNVNLGVFPLIQAGNLEDLRLLCNELGISNHSNQSDGWVKAERSNNSIQWKPVKNSPDAVPDVRGMTLKDALYILENKGLKVHFKGRGRVVEQSMMPGTKALRGSQIYIRLS
jgi:cell division protein FtsI (penicillin-binding protein 3)